VIAAIKKPQAQIGHQYNKGEWLMTVTSLGTEGVPVGVGAVVAAVVAEAGLGLVDSGGVLDMGSISLPRVVVATKRS